MSNKHKFGNNEKLYFVSFSVVYWIDLFIRNEYKQILINSWNYCKSTKGLPKRWIGTSSFRSKSTPTYLRQIM